MWNDPQEAWEFVLTDHPLWRSKLKEAIEYAINTMTKKLEDPQRSMDEDTYNNMSIMRNDLRRFLSWIDQINAKDQK